MSIAYGDKRAYKLTKKQAEQTARELSRLDGIEASIAEMKALLERITHAIETGAIGPGALDEETGPAVVRRRRRRSDDGPDKGEGD